MSQFRFAVVVAIGMGVIQPAIFGQGGFIASAQAQAQAQTQASFSIDNTVIDMGFATYKIARMEVSGSSLTREELTGLFDKNAAEPLAKRLERLSASQILIPELIVEQVGQPGGTPPKEAERQIQVYKNVKLEDIKQGRIARLASSNGTFESVGKTKASGTFGETSITDFDLPLLAKIYLEKADKPGELQTVYNLFSLQSVTFKTQDEVEGTITKLEGRGVKARPTTASLVDIASSLKAEDMDQLPPKERSQKVRQALAILDAFSIDQMEASGFNVRSLKGEDQFTVQIARMVYTGDKADKPGEVRLEDIGIGAKDGRAKIGLISFAGFSFEPTFKALSETSDKTIEELVEADPTRFMPKLGTIRFEGFDFDLPRKDAPATERVQFKLKSFELGASEPFNNIPTKLRMAFENFAFTVPEKGKEAEAFKDLRDLGYKAVDLSATLAGGWNSQTKEFSVSEYSTRGMDMGNVLVKATLGNVSQDAFSTDQSIAMGAWISATAKSLDLSLDNAGLFERLVQREAAKRKKKPEDVRNEWSAMATIAIPAFLGDTPEVKAVAQAVARFIAKPQRLAINVNAKDSGGLALATFAVAQPQEIVKRLDIKASAE